MQLRKLNHVTRDTQPHKLDLTGGLARLIPLELPLIPKQSEVEILQGPVFVLDGKGQTLMAVKISFSYDKVITREAWALASNIDLILAEAKQNPLRREK